MLESVIADGQALVYMERHVDEGAKTYSALAGRSEAEARYRPESDAPWFELVTVLLPWDQVSLFKADPAPGLLGQYIESSHVRFAVHPQTWASVGREQLHGFAFGPPIKVAPTASTRTVLALDPAGPPHYLKLHYPVCISRFNRRLRRKNIHNSIAAAADIAHFRSDKFAHLPDVAGVTLGKDDESWGFLIREAIPRPAVSDRFLIPFFALFAGDSGSPDDPPLLVQLIERLAADPTEFLIEKLLAPIVEIWTTVVRERGLLLELHAQNTLLEIDRELSPRRIVYRDFDVWIDPATRRRAGLDMPFIGTSSEPDGSPSSASRYSLVYDRFIGHGLFDYLLGAVRQKWVVDEDFVRARVREAFHRGLPEADKLLPAETMFYFSPESQDHFFAVEDMHQAPIWR